MKHRQRRGGFTLIEVLIALALFSTIATFSYAVLSESARTSRAISEQMAALNILQRTLQSFSNDFSQLQPRSVREPIGSARRAPLLADSRNEILVELTRGGHPNPLGLPRASAQRIAYRLQDNTLQRLVWPVLDPVLATEPEIVDLMDDVERIEINYLDTAPDSWTREWPLGGGASSVRPRAIEIIIEQADWGEIRRLLETSY